MKKFKVTYIRTIAESYYITAKNKQNAELKAEDRELNDEPDDEETIECTSEIEELK